jgi:AcrR family transcriptional regulator
VTATGRTQEERRAETRTRLLDAAVQSLAEVGLAATTTRRVCEIAGVSMGAMTHHFPHRVDMLGGAAEHLAARRIAELVEMAEDFPDDPRERLAILLDLLWADFNSTTFDVFVKLWVASADDPELYERMVPVERQVTESLASLATDLIGTEFASQPDWVKRLSVAMATVRGLALTEHFEPRGRRRRDPWPDTRATLLEMLFG